MVGERLHSAKLSYALPPSATTHQCFDLEVYKMRAQALMGFLAAGGLIARS